MAKSPRRLKLAVEEQSSAAPLVDWEWIEAREGGMATIAYVPRDGAGEPLGQSGVTVGAGVDLGHWSRGEIAGWGAAPALLDRLADYLGKRGHEAIRALAIEPLAVTDEEAVLLSRGARNTIVADVASRYGIAAGVEFDTIPQGARTVIASVAFQYGSRLDRRCPRFWRAVTGRRWDAAVAELRAFGDAYPSRRRLEAELLEAAVAAKPQR